MNSFEHARFMGGAPRCIAVCKDQSSIRHFVVCLCVDLGGFDNASSGPSELFGRMYRCLHEYSLERGHIASAHASCTGGCSATGPAPRRCARGDSRVATLVKSHTSHVNEGVTSNNKNISEGSGRAGCRDAGAVDPLEQQQGWLLTTPRARAAHSGICNSESRRTRFLFPHLRALKNALHAQSRRRLEDPHGIS